MCPKKFKVLTFEDGRRPSKHIFLLLFQYQINNVTKSGNRRKIRKRLVKGSCEIKEEKPFSIFDSIFGETCLHDQIKKFPIYIFSLYK